MSETTAPIETETETEKERETLLRIFPFELEATGDGRTIEGLVVPYNKPQTVSDPPDFRPYQEVFLPGAFRNAVKAPNRVLLDFEHYGAIADALKSGGSMAGALGHAVELEERPDGLWGRFRVLNHTDGDKALEFVREKVLAGFSAVFNPLRSVRLPDGTMQRVKVHLDRVSLCRVGAYPEAQVLALRTAHPVEFEPLPPFDQEVAGALAKFVYVPPALTVSSKEETP